MKTAPQMRDYTDPAKFIADCRAHLASLQGDGDGARADASEEDRADESDTEERTDAAPVMGADPWAYARACEAHLARRVARLDGKSAPTSDDGGRADATEEGAIRYSEGRIG